MKVFKTFKCLGQNSSNSSCQFWNDESIPLQILHHSATFLGQTLNTLQIGANESASFRDFRVLGSNFTEFLSFFKQQISFSSNFASIFRVTPLYFLAKILYTLRSPSKYKFGEILREQSKV